MKAIAASFKPVFAAPGGCWPAWLLSAAALGAALVPGAGPWAALLFALATAYWTWLFYGSGRRPAAVAGEAYALHHSESLRKLIVESSRTAGNDLRALRSDLEQVRGLVHDAVVTLGDGFQHIHEQMGGGREQLAALMERLHGPSGSTHAMLQELQRAFHAHLDNLADIGRDRDNAVRRMDGLMQQMDAVADHAGPRGGTAAEDAGGLPGRLHQLRDLTAEARRAVEAVIMRDLTAAIGTKRVIDGMLAESSDLNHYLTDALARTSSTGAELQDSLGILVRSLQFEDVVRQLLEYCDRQVAGIETYIDGMTALLADPQLGQRPEEQRAKLMHACESYLDNSTRWASDRQRHITQTSMQAGNVELF